MSQSPRRTDRLCHGQPCLKATIAERLGNLLWIERKTCDVDQQAVDLDAHRRTVLVAPLGELLERQPIGLWIVLLQMHTGDFRHRQPDEVRPLRSYDSALRIKEGNEPFRITLRAHHALY